MASHQTKTADQIETEVQFGIVPRWVIERAKDPRALQVFALLAAKYARGDRTAYPSRATLARDLACSTKSIDRAITALLNIQALTIAKRKSTGRYPSNLYTLRHADPLNQWTPVSSGHPCPVDTRVANLGTPVSHEPDPVNQIRVRTPLPPSSPLLFQEAPESGTDKAQSPDSTTSAASSTAASKQRKRNPSSRPITKAERRRAERVLTAQQGCLHEPRCQTNAYCIGRLVGAERRALIAGAENNEGRQLTSFGDALVAGVLASVASTRGSGADGHDSDHDSERTQ
jgi:hypothetical protein